MKNKILLSLALVTLLAAVFYFANPLKLNTQRGRKSPVDHSVSTNSNDNIDMQSVEGSFLDILELGESYVCNFEYVDGLGNNTDGTVYVGDSGVKMNAEFHIREPNGASFTSNFINDGEYSYIWSSLLTTGYKINTQDYEPTSEDETQGMFNFNSDISLFDPETDPTKNDNVNFECSDWSMDNSKFVPPSSINFFDVTPGTTGLSNQTGEDVNPQCTYCYDLPEGDARDQCLKALSCGL